MIQDNNNFTMYGIWYSPYKPGVRIRGVLERKDFDKTLLNIYCLSEYEYESFKNAKVIQGINSIGQNITLLDCFVAREKSIQFATIAAMH
jgi:predicted CoA-binding protein